LQSLEIGAVRFGRRQEDAVERAHFASKYLQFLALEPKRFLHPAPRPVAPGGFAQLFGHHESRTRPSAGTRAGAIGTPTNAQREQTVAESARSGRGSKSAVKLARSEALRAREHERVALKSGCKYLQRGAYATCRHKHKTAAKSEPRDGLEEDLLALRELDAALGTAASNQGAATVAGHASAETMLALAGTRLGLVCPFHNRYLNCGFR
jgi:hypothetical protein